MLSRVAESVYWMSRYLERAESVARLVDVNLHLSLDCAADYGDQWEPLISATGGQALFASRYERAGRENVTQFLTFDRDNPNSIISCAWRARENARAVRDTISSEMWEQTNRFYTYMKGCAESHYAQTNPHDFYTDVKMATHLFDGIADATMSHGEAWHFLRLGEMIERADKTSRILDVKYFILLPRWQAVGGAVDSIQWVALLKSASAFEMYRKRYKSISPTKVADFLLLNAEFPRAVRWCLDRAVESLQSLMGPMQQDIPHHAERQLSALACELHGVQMADIISQGLHEFLDGLQGRLNAIDRAITETFFSVNRVPAAAKSSPACVGQ